MPRTRCSVGTRGGCGSIYNATLGYTLQHDATLGRLAVQRCGLTFPRHLTDYINSINYAAQSLQTMTAVAMLRRLVTLYMMR